MRATSDVMLRTNDFKSAKAYYNGVLGFPTIAEAENLLGFDLGEFVLYFEHGDGNGSVFEFEVPNLAEAKERLFAQGCTLVEENPALPRCYLRDPYGLIFNLTETFRS
jgi:catechol 2,3-dioxygenase-like lactoylglutathione lyase family enzyme